MASQGIKSKMCSLKIEEDSSKKDSYSVINKLNNDCLIYIFKFLSVVDRVKFERVSKMWQEFSKESWGSLKVLELDPKCLGLKPRGIKHEYPEITKYITEQILKRC